METADEIREQAFRDVGEKLNLIILSHRKVEVQGSFWNKRMRWIIDVETGSLFWKFVQALTQGKLEI